MTGREREEPFAPHAISRRPSRPSSRAAVTTQSPSQVFLPCPTPIHIFAKSHGWVRPGISRRGGSPGGDPYPRSPTPRRKAHLAERPSLQHRTWLLQRMPFPAAPAAPLRLELLGKRSSSSASTSEASEAWEPRELHATISVLLNLSPTFQQREEAPNSSEASSPQSLDLSIHSFLHWRTRYGSLCPCRAYILVKGRQTSLISK